ncbi:MAG: response regulator transcription factor [Alphaproteobacteria bacterium]|nr:response regulator transcription factor [Alphaproteobacteria bacterium]
MRVLLVEDNERFAELVCDALTADGFVVDVAHTLAKAKACLGLVPYDLLLLDLSLPDGDGLSIVSMLTTQKSTIPRLIMTARGGLDDRLTGLNLGADDYMVKPFATAELIARCRALLRRPGGVLGTVLSAGNLSFNTINREVSVNGKRVNISTRELGLLEHLMRRVGHVVPRSQLEASMYNFEKEVTPNALEVSVSRLRRWLKTSQVDANLHTMHGVGYALTVDTLVANTNGTV